MDQHPHDLLPGFALGALDAAETLLVVTHLQDCPGCRDEVETFRATVSVLPYTATVQEPPLHVKQQLFARIAAMHPSTMPHSRSTAPAMAVPPWTRWVGALAAVSLVLVLAMSAFAMNTQRQLAETQQQLAALQRQVTATSDAQLIAFMSEPATVSRPLQASTSQVTGRMFMQPGHKKVVIMVQGLPSAAAGQTYRCWLATATDQTKVCAFTETKGDSAEVLFEAPEPIDSYQQVMLTLEPVDSTHPNLNDVILQTSIS